MPELAECALFCHDINQKIKNSALTRIAYNQADWKWGRKIAPEVVRERLTTMIDKDLEFVSFGKAICMAPARELGLDFRLGMTGRFLLNVPEHQRKHIFLELGFDNGVTINFVDFRRFGTIVLEEVKMKPQRWIGGYSKGFIVHGKEEIAFLFGDYKVPSRTPRITTLLTTGKETGVGNYLAIEALGECDLSPFEPFKSTEEFVEVLNECGKVARRSYSLGGNSFAGGYVRLDGSLGQFDSVKRFYKNPTIPKVVFRGRPVYSNYKPDPLRSI